MMLNTGERTNEQRDGGASDVSVLEKSTKMQTANGECFKSCMQYCCQDCNCDIQVLFLSRHLCLHYQYALQIPTDGEGNLSSQGSSALIFDHLRLLVAPWRRVDKPLHPSDASTLRTMKANLEVAGAEFPKGQMPLFSRNQHCLRTVLLYKDVVMLL